MPIETNECLKFDDQWFKRLAWDDRIRWLRTNNRVTDYMSSHTFQYCIFETEVMFEENYDG
jgi:hypothetical protein